MAESDNDANRAAERCVDVALAVVFDDQRRVLICKRKAEAVLGGYWEFPGGKCEAGERLADCAVREVAEETALVVEAQRALGVMEHEYAHGRVRLHPFVCRHVSGEVELREVAEARWVPVEELAKYRFPEANGPLLREVASLGTATGGS